MFVDLDSSHDKGLVLNVPKNSHHPTIGDQSDRYGCFGDVKQISNYRDINPNPCMNTG